MSEGTTNNLALYKAMNKPFKTEEAHGDALRMFFRAVEDNRRLFKLPDVVIIVRSSHKLRGKAEEHSMSSLFLGDSASAVWMVCETLNRLSLKAAENHIEITPRMIAAEPDLLRTMEEIISTIVGSRTVSIGSLNNTYEVQIGKEQVQRWQAALAKARGEETK